MGAGTLIGARLLQYAGDFVLFGTPLFFLYGTRAPSGAAPLQGSWERRVLLMAAAIGLLGAIVWLMAETVAISGDTADATNPTALWTILSETPFGFACLARMVLLVLSLAVCFAVSCPRVLWWVQVILGGAITMSFAWTGHGAAEIGKTAGIHLAGDLLHLLAAGIWIGALLPLAVLGFRAMRSGAIEDGQVLLFALKEFSAIGVWVVAVLVFSGIINSIFLLDLAHWREALNSPYGKVLLVKVAIFGGMLGCAALHRYRSTPALARALEHRTSLAAPLKAAGSSLVIETLLAALVLGAVSVLGTLAPPDIQAGHSSSQRAPLPRLDVVARESKGNRSRPYPF